MAIEFTFTPKQQMFQRVVRNYLRLEVWPNVDEDKSGHGTFPKKTIQEMGKLGLLGIPFPKEYGGAGLGEIGYCIFVEEIGRIDASIATIVAAHQSIGTTPVWLFGTEDQRRKYLPGLTDGRHLAAFALTEPTAGSDAASIKTQARREGDYYIVNGRKLWCTNGDQADVIVLTCVTDPALGARGGVTSFILEKGTKGFSIGTIEDKMGIRNSSTAELIFEDCAIPAENVLGRVGEGFIVALTALDGGRTGLAAGSLGGAQTLLETSIDYVRSRRRHGQPLSQEQAVQWRLADMAVEINLTKYATYHTAALVDEYYHLIAGGKHVPDALRDKISMNAATIKVFASEMTARCVESALEIQGGSSIWDRNRVERAWRDHIIAEIYEGTSEIQRLIIARDVLKMGGTY
ncbi:MAG: acyl-CoA dehydrogenase family protein [Euryarchaeota archaeon]|nr:acyl-CoA dehydrogenase family protein [Euryarchaeota archaeon]